MLALGFLLVLALDARRAEARLRPAGEHVRRRQLRVGAARGARRLGRERRARGDLRDERRGHVHAPGRAAHRQAPGRRRRGPTSPGIVFLEIDGLALPVLRRAMRDGNAPEHGALGRRGHARAHRVGAGPLVADGREPGGDPARLERRHPRVPLGRQGDRAADGLLGAGRLRPDRARARDGHRAARRRRHEPRQPPLGRGRRGDPHGQPDGGGEEGEPRLPRVLRQRLQRHAGARPVLLGGAAGVVRPRCARSGATCGRADIAAGCTRSCARRCA